MTFYFNYFFTLLALVISCISLQAENTQEQFVLATQPKAGTHLMLKLMSKLRGNSNTRLFSLNRSEPQCYYPGIFGDCLASGELPWTHLYNPFELRELFFSRHKDMKVLVLIRDIRDVYVSYAHWMYRSPSMTAEQKINTIMAQHKCFYEMNRNLHIFLNNPRFFVVRFEDLIGPAGGGNKEKQTETIYKIAEYIGLPITMEVASQYGDELFGDTSGTFRKGQIGSWRTEMNKDQKKWMLDHFGKELIKLNYEKYYSWN